MQERIHEYKQEDSTFSLNRKYLGILDAGVYRGFDAILGDNMILTLTHTMTGVKQYDLDLSPKDVGVIITKQGNVIREDEDITLNINVGPSGSYESRIDLIVVEHRFVETTGGTQALYSVIEGVPDQQPVVPNLLNEATQVPIATMQVYENSQELNGTRNFFKKFPPPNYSGTSDALLKSENLNDVVDKQTARDNLQLRRGVEITSEIEDAVNVVASAIIGGANTNFNTLGKLEAILQGDPNIIQNITSALSGKVDKISGKGLSQEDFTATLLGKLNSINLGAAVGNVPAIGEALGANKIVETNGSGELKSVSKGSAHNKSWAGTGGHYGTSGSPARSNHYHTSYAAIETKDIKTGTAAFTDNTSGDIGIDPTSYTRILKTADKILIEFCLKVTPLSGSVPELEVGFDDVSVFPVVTGVYIPFVVRRSGSPEPCYYRPVASTPTRGFFSMMSGTFNWNIQYIISGSYTRIL